MKLGAYPSHRYSRSWVTQRLVNRAPEETIARRSPGSVMQQLLNPISQEIEKTIKGLTDERFNMFISTANPAMMDVVYRAQLPASLALNRTEHANGTIEYVVPTVYATISGTEYEISIAEKNDIETFWNFALPSRIEDREKSLAYQAVLPSTAVSDLGTATINSVPIKGHLHFTLKNNSNWEVKQGTRIYYPKVYIKGLTRKGVELTEVIGLRYNGTFKTINQWTTVEEVFVSYLSEDALISLESFPFDAESILDTRNLAVPNSGGERMAFSRLNNEQLWGSSLISDTFTSADMNIIRLGVDEKDKQYEIELLDVDGFNVTAATGMVSKPETDYLLVVDGTRLFIYDNLFPYPDTDQMHSQSSDPKIDLYSNRWTFAKDETATVKTQNLDIANVPFQTRWIIEDPNKVSWYLGLDGSFWPLTTPAWIENVEWENNLFKEQEIDVDLTLAGTYKITFEAQYLSRDTGEAFSLTTKLLWFVPAIRAEAEYTLPATLINPDNIFIDSDGLVWLLKGNDIHQLDIFYDYFLVDYKQNLLFMREDYNSIRVVP